MIGLTVKQAREGFFDRPAVVRAVGKTRAAVLSKFGAYVRRSARSSIRPGGKKGKVSKAGEPPRSHVGTLRERISFAWDQGRQSLVVGPERLNKPGATPHVLEFGGQVGVFEARFPGARDRRWRQVSPRVASRLGMQTRRRSVTIAPRPYMLPALEKNRSVLPPMWANSLRAA